jgi:hypothetical protein
LTAYSFGSPGIDRTAMIPVAAGINRGRVRIAALPPIA